VAQIPLAFMFTCGTFGQDSKGILRKVSYHRYCPYTSENVNHCASRALRTRAGLIRVLQDMAVPSSLERQGGRPQGRGKCPSALVTFHLFEVNFKQMSTLTCRPNDMRSSVHLQVRWIDAHTAGRNITVALHPAVSNFQTHDHSNQ